MVKIAVTGNIGSGKTTVIKLFEQYGFPIFNSDLVSRDAENDPVILTNFLDIVGHDVLVDGEIDRNLMRERVFNDSNLLQRVNDLMVPYVKNEYLKFLNEYKEEKATIMESAIIFETYTQNKFDVVITVVADKETRLKRVLERDGIGEELALAKMKNQLSDDHKVKYSDFIIINEDMPNCDNITILRKQIEQILKILNL
jgi:dephospho-CoA kinase